MVLSLTNCVNQAIWKKKVPNFYGAESDVEERRSYIPVEVKEIVITVASETTWA